MWQFPEIFELHEQQIYHTTSLDKTCLEFEFQTDRYYCVHLRQTYLAGKLRNVKDRGYENYNAKEVRKVHKEDPKADGAMEEVKHVPVVLVFHVNNLLHSIFSNVELYTNNQQVYH